MRKLLLALMILSGPGALSAKDCHECKGKRSQKANEILIDVKNDSLIHYGLYLGGHVETIWDGPDKGHQKIYFGEFLFAESKEFREDNGYIINYYPQFKVCSSEENQMIRMRR